MKSPKKPLDKSLYICNETVYNTLVERNMICYNVYEARNHKNKLTVNFELKEKMYGTY